MLIDVKEKYQKNLQPLADSLAVRNVFALPKLTKVTLNVGLGPHRQNKDMVAYIQESLAKISGQKPAPTHARKAISGFKLREGELVGLRVTLRGQKMVDFINRLINITLPRIRDFKGLDQAQFDKQGNLTIGFKDQVPFAELGHDVLDKPFGLSVVLTIKNSDPAKTLTLLRTLGFPLKSK